MKLGLISREGSPVKILLGPEDENEKEIIELLTKADKVSVDDNPEGYSFVSLALQFDTAILWGSETN